jgi:hypothetical protein
LLNAHHFALFLDFRSTLVPSERRRRHRAANAGCHRGRRQTDVAAHSLTLRGSTTLATVVWNDAIALDGLGIMASADTMTATTAAPSMVVSFDSNPSGDVSAAAASRLPPRRRRRQGRAMPSIASRPWRAICPARDWCPNRCARCAVRRSRTCRSRIPRRCLRVHSRARLAMRHCRQRLRMAIWSSGTNFSMSLLHRRAA